MENKKDYECRFNVKKDGTAIIRSISIYDGDLVIPPMIGKYKITEVPDNFMSGNSEIKNLYIAKNIKKIGKNAFKDCKNLRHIYTDNDLEEIGDSAFENCFNLEDYMASINVKYIGNNSFKNTGITKLILNSKLEKIGESAFENCEYLSLISFRHCDKMKYISDSCFNGCKGLKYLTLPSNITSIGASAFENCEKLTIIDFFPKNLKSIGDKAFYKCRDIEDIKLNCEHLKYIGDYAFSDCESIVRFTFSYLNNNIKFGVGVFKNCFKIKNIELPNTHEISKEMFSGCKSLTEIISNDNVNIIGESAFRDCINLKSILNCKGVRRYDEKCFENTPKFKVINYYGSKYNSEYYNGLSQFNAFSENPKKVKYRLYNNVFSKLFSKV